MLPLNPIVVAVVALCAVCTLQAAPTAEDLVTPTLATLEEAMKRAVDTARPKKSAQYGMIIRYYYAANARQFMYAKTLEEKLDALESDWARKSIWPVVEDVWTYFKNVSRGKDKYELRSAVLADCKKLDEGLKPITSKVRRMDRYERESFFRKDKESARLVNLSRFCKILADNY